MTAQLKKFGLGFLILLTTVFSSCEKDLYEEAKQNNQSKIVFENISLKELSISKVDKKLFSKLDELKNKQKNLGRGIVYDSIYNFFIDQDKGRYIEANGKTTYTFPIYKIGSDYKVENIIFTLNPDGDYDVATTKYDISKEELESPTYSGIPSIIDYHVLLNRVTELGPTPIYMTILMCDNDGSGGTGPSHPAGTNCTSPNHLFTITIFMGYTIPGNYSDIGEGGNNSDHVGNVSVTATSPVSISYPNAFLTFISSLGNDDAAIFTNLSMEAQDVVMEYLFSLNYLGLSPARNAIINLLNNSTTANWLSTATVNQQTEIFEYLAQNDFSTQSVTFVNQCVNTMSQNPGVFSSIKPFQIEKNIDDTLLDDCTKNLLNDLKGLQQADIAKVLAKLANPQSVYNTKIIIADPVSSTAYASAGWDTTPSTINPNNSVSSPFNYKIKVRENYLNGILLTANNPPIKKPTKLSIARTLIHEIIHVYFDSLLDDCYQNNNCTEIKNFPELWNLYVAYKSQGDTSDPSHIAIANLYVKIIASALKEFQTGNSVLNNPIGSDQDYLDLAWYGLYSSNQFANTKLNEIFNLEYPVGSDKKIRFEKINAAEDMQESTFYLNISPKSTPCN